MALDELEAATLEEVEDCAIALLVADEEALFSTGVIIIVGGLGGKLSGLPSYNATEEDEETIVEDEDDDTDSDDELAGVILMAGLFAVPYTHLTLPTNRKGGMLGGVWCIKKKKE